MLCPRPISCEGCFECFRSRLFQQDLSYFGFSVPYSFVSVKTAYCVTSIYYVLHAVRLVYKFILSLYNHIAPAAFTRTYNMFFVYSRDTSPAYWEETPKDSRQAAIVLHQRTPEDPLEPLSVSRPSTQSALSLRSYPPGGSSSPAVYERHSDAYIEPLSIGWTSTRSTSSHRSASSHRQYSRGRSPGPAIVHQEQPGLSSEPLSISASATRPYSRSRSSRPTIYRRQRDTYLTPLSIDKPSRHSAASCCSDACGCPLSPVYFVID